MNLARIKTRAAVGMQAPEVMVEVHLSNGLPAFSIVGLPETSVKEAKERVRSALLNSQFEFPAKRITVNLAPADLPKEGGRFDLAIAVGILIASGQLSSTNLNELEFFGELALDGEIRTVSGLLPSIIASSMEKRFAIIPVDSYQLAQFVEEARLLAAPSLKSLWQHLMGQKSLATPELMNLELNSKIAYSNLADVKGQQQGKRALEIAAAGGHNLLFLGPPGTGKSMLAQRLPGILPEMTAEQALQTAAVYSIQGREVSPDNWRVRPFRSPHHTCSAVALVGGSSNPKPGEISLAHNGVLFLDELTEFDRKVLDSLREPMETGQVIISRAARQVEFPARFQLIAALNPSPTGSIEDRRSTPEQILKYLGKISGPFLDRIDLQIELPRLKASELQTNQVEEGSDNVKKRVERAQSIQLHRQGKLNAHLGSDQINEFCFLNADCRTFMERACDKLQLSPRAYHKVIKVARTLADLSANEDLQLSHLKEAINYRAMERLLQRLT